MDNRHFKPFFIHANRARNRMAIYMQNRKLKDGPSHGLFDGKHLRYIEWPCVEMGLAAERAFV
jgi:hypothetical protein